MSSRSTIASIVPALAVMATGVAAVAPAQAATTTSITAATAGQKALGATTYMWGTSNAPAGARVCSQVYLTSGWSTSQCSTIQSDHSYTVELTYGKNYAGTYTFRAVTGNIASSPVTLQRGTSTPAPSKPAPTKPAPTAPATRYTSSTTTNVRSAASTSASVVGTLAPAVKVTGTISGSWLRITTPNMYAGRYISTTVLTSAAPAGSTSGAASTYQGGTFGNAYTLYSGYNGVKVYLAQKALGMNPGPMDSTLGPATSKNLAAFQRAHGLPANGILDLATWNALAPRDTQGVRYPFAIDSWAKTSDVMDGASRDVRVAAMYSFADAQIGKPYIWGGTGPMGFDCSGLLLEAARAAGMTPVKVGNTTDTRPASDLSNQMWNDNEFEKGSLSNLHFGDFVYFGGSNGVAHHVSMFVGNNTFINAIDTKVQVSTGQLTSHAGWSKTLGVNRAIRLDNSN